MALQNSEGDPSLWQITTCGFEKKLHFVINVSAYVGSNIRQDTFGVDLPMYAHTV